MALRPKVTLYFDIHSPYSYLAFYALKNWPVFRSCDVTFVPVLLVAFIKATGLIPPWSSPNKVKWMETDLARWAREMGIPWRSGWPANYPMKATTMKVQRTLVACSRESPERCPDLIGALYHDFWVEKKGVQLPEVYEPIVTNILGRDVASSVIAKSSSEEIKTALRQNTEEAVGSGAPGLPWVRAVNSEGHEEGFFGFDHLGQVARFLGLDKPSGPHL